MVNGNSTYAEVQGGDEVLILAEPRVEPGMKEARLTKYQVIKTLKGKDLVGPRYEHPLKDIVEAQRV